MNLACSTSFSRAPLETVLPLIAAAGYNRIDLLGIPAWGHVVPAKLETDFETEARRIESLLARHQLQVATMNVAVPVLHDRRDAGRNEERRRQGEAIARLMARLGVSLDSCYPGPCSDRPRAELLADMRMSIDELRAIGETHGVEFAIEPHYNTPFETPEQCKELLDTSPGLPLVYAPSHFVMQGIALEQTRFLLGLSRHVHLRDAVPGRLCVPLGEGAVDFAWLGRELAERRYAGTMAVELLPDKLPDPVAELSAYRRLLLPGWGDAIIS